MLSARTAAATVAIARDFIWLVPSEVGFLGTASSRGPWNRNVHIQPVFLNSRSQPHRQPLWPMSSIPGPVCSAGRFRARGQHRQQLFVGPTRPVRVDGLDADMVGAGVPMFLDPLADRRLVTPSHIGVDKPVGTAAIQIVAKAEPL